jgi:hypothetical protein
MDQIGFMYTDLALPIDSGNRFHHVFQAEMFWNCSTQNTCISQRNQVGGYTDLLLAARASAKFIR